MPAMSSSTWLSQPSSCFDRVGPWSVYHDPAWLASLIVIEGYLYRGFPASIRWMWSFEEDWFDNLE